MRTGGESGWGDVELFVKTFPHSASASARLRSTYRLMKAITTRHPLVCAHVMVEVEVEVS